MIVELIILRACASRIMNSPEGFLKSANCYVP